MFNSVGPSFSSQARGKLHMRSLMTVVVWLAIMGVGFADLAGAQKSSGPAPQALVVPPTALALSNVVRFSAQTNSGDLADRVNAERIKSDTQASARKLIESMGLPCEVAEAVRVGYLQSNVDAKSADAKDKDRKNAEAAAEGKVPEVTVYGKVPGDTSIYEVACQDGAGYLLVSQGRDKPPLAISCIAADAAHTTDVAQGVKSEFYCDLPANRNIKAMATKLMSVAGTPCTVSKLRWMGVNMASQTEYSEVACEDEKGFLLKTPMHLGAQISTIGCQEAVASGLQCLFTDGGPTPAVTMQMLLDALKRNGVNCEPDQMRYIGRESVGKRYVVEVLSPERPNGLVSFIPVRDTTKPFETIDCLTAAARNIQCKLAAR